MFGRKKKEIKRWRVKISELGPLDMHLINNDFEMNLTQEAVININTKLIDCDNGGTCETKVDGGFRIELTPLQ